MYEDIEIIFLIIFIIINFTEPVLGVSDILSYLHYFSYVSKTNAAQLTNQITGEAIALPFVILIEITDAILSTLLSFLAFIILDLLSEGGGSSGGKTVHFSDGRIVTFRNR